MKMDSADPIAVALSEAVHAGDLVALRRLLDEHQDLATARIRDRKGASRTPLHVATDWPGYYPNGPEVVSMLIEAGADPSAPIIGGRHSETPDTRHEALATWLRAHGATATPAVTEQPT